MSTAQTSSLEESDTLMAHLANSQSRTRYVLSVEQLGPARVEELLATGREITLATGKRQALAILNGVVLDEIFYELSTRTSTSFDSTVNRDGGQTAILNESHRSTQKEELLEDTIRTVGQYIDVVLLRHLDEGALAAAVCSPAFIINGKNGAMEHLTQGPLDLLTINEELGSVDGLNIKLVGDVKYDRTVRICASFYGTTWSLPFLPLLQVWRCHRSSLSEFATVGNQTS